MSGEQPINTSLKLIIITYLEYTLHQSVFQCGPAKMMYNTVTKQYNAMRYNAMRYIAIIIMHYYAFVIVSLT